MSPRSTSFALIAAAIAFSPAARAFEVKHTAGGGLVSWRRSSVSWTIDPSVRKIRGGEKAIADATKAWTTREGAPALSIATTSIALRPGLDEKNAVFYAPDGFAAAGSALAITILSFDDTTGEVVDADIVINGKYKFAPFVLKDGEGAAPSVSVEVGSKSDEDATYDIGRVLAHEMGHALALSDEPARQDALMFPYVARSRALAASPGADDLAGVGMLYGPNAGSASSSEGSAGCTTAHRAPRGGGGLPVTGLAAAALGLAALVMARGGPRRRGGAACTGVAALALVILPPASSTTNEENDVVVRALRTTNESGLFRTEVEVVAKGCRADCATTRSTVWGGTVGGITQVIGDARVPTIGQRIGTCGGAQ
jgi:hypothetical protein